ncbi:MAG: VWA domain-containing protein [Acidimicrobiia bacterium]|nr:VWA domain-containing protein [Acidimicrobiia bacterium]
MHVSVRLRAWLQLSGLLLLAGVAGLTGLSAQPARAPSATPIRVDVNYVEQDVRVVDRAGRFISGLTAADFRVVEDGVGQRIRAFGEVQIPFVRSTQAPQAGSEATAIEPDAVSNLDGDGRLYLIVLDDYHVASASSAQTKELAKRFILDHLSADDYAAVLVTSGDVNATQDFTRNRRLLLDAIDRFSGRKLPPATLAMIEARQMREAGASRLSQEDPDAMERMANARATMRSLTAIADWLSPIRGRRKSVVYFSEGVDNFQYFDLFGAREYAIGEPQNYNSRERSFAAVREATWEAAAASARANVQIYPVDPRGLTAGSDLIQTVGVPTGAFTAGSASAAVEIKTSQENLLQLAEQTGGLAAVNTNDFRGAFDRVVEENSAYYVIGYQSGNQKRDGRMRSVSITVPSRPDARLVYRTRYAVARGRARQAPESGGAASDILAQLNQQMSNPLPQTDLGLHASAIPYRGSGKAAAVDIVIDATGSNLQFNESNGAFRDIVSFSVQAIDRRGRPAAGEQFEIELNLQREAYERLVKHSLRVIRTLELSPGQYSLRIAAQDSVGGKRGTLRLDVEVPDFEKQPLALSGIALASALSPAFSSWQRSFAATLPGVPTALRAFASGDQLAAFVEIYETRILEVEDLSIVTNVTSASSGRVVFTSRGEQSTGDVKKRPGALAYSTRLPLTNWAPGAYVLSIEAHSPRGDRPPVKRVVPFAVRQ